MSENQTLPDCGCEAPDELTQIKTWLVDKGYAAEIAEVAAFFKRFAALNKGGVRLRGSATGEIYLDVEHYGGVCCTDAIDFEDVTVELVANEIQGIRRGRY